MTEPTTEPTTEWVDPTNTPAEASASNEAVAEADESSSDVTEPDTFPREVVEKLRQENGKYRQRAQQSDAFAQRLHTELVRATNRLADPADLPFDEAHLDDPDALTAAVDQLLEQKPHLATRRPVGDIGQGNRGAASESFSLLGMLKEQT
jgi:hypothetical protein